MTGVEGMKPSDLRAGMIVRVPAEDGLPTRVKIASITNDAIEDALGRWWSKDEVQPITAPDGTVLYQAGGAQ